MRLITICILFSLNAKAACWENFKSETSLQMETREKKYREFDKKFEKLSPESKAYTLDGKKPELVMLIHGFLANPEEMKSIASALNEQGYYVYSGLIPGYGATAKVANKFRRSEWIKWNENEITRAEKCFDKIHLIGFSTGATLFHDYVSRNKQDSKIASVTLISAFFKTHFTFNMALKLVKASQAKEMKISSLFKFLPVSDVQVIIDNPQTYLQVVPLTSMQEVIKLGKENQRRKIASKSLTVPTLAIISEEDVISDPDTMEKVINRNFENLQMRTYDSPGHVPHQIMAKSVSRVADQVESQIMNFISSH